MSLQIRHYDASMQPDIEKFYVECFYALGWEFEPNGRHSDIINIPEIYLKGGQFWCAYDGELLVGTVATRIIDEVSQVVELKRLYVLPKRKGEGIGGMLFETALQYVKEKGFKKVYADTRNDRSASKHLMQKHGFREVPQYNDNEFAELFFERCL